MATVTGEAIWLDGQFVAWDAARVHVLTHTLHYGLGVFEGIRCYRTEDGRSAVFRLQEHVRRLFDSAHINLMAIPFTREAVSDAVVATLRANRLAEGYKQIMPSYAGKIPDDDLTRLINYLKSDMRAAAGDPAAQGGTR